MRSRRRRDADDGVRILGSSPRAAEHAAVQLLRGPAERRVCLLSDGLERVVSPFGLTDREGLFTALQEGRAGPLVQRLRRLERQDALCLRCPRLTPHDDVTGLAIAL